MALITTEITGEDIADAMNDDGSFMIEILSVIAERVDMGLMRDNASDLASTMPVDQVRFISAQLSSLSDAMKNGFNMASTSTQIT